MRELRFVTLREDGAHVVLETSDGAEQFSVPLDAALRDAIGANSESVETQLDPTPDAAGGPSFDPVAHALPAPLTAEPILTIPPREIQIRVRAGESPHQLAESSGMSLDRVLRFAQPVLDERARIADEARRARARRSTTEGQIVIFGETVDARFAKHGLDPVLVRWDAHRRDDGQWIVSAHWIGGESERSAEWLFHLAGRTVTPLDDTAADLLSDRPIRPVGVSTEGARPELAIVASNDIADFPSHDDQVFDQEAPDDLHGPRHALTDVSRPGDYPPTSTGEYTYTSTVAEYVIGELSDEPSPDEGFGGYETPSLPLRLADGDAGDGALFVDDTTSRTNRLPRVTNLGVAQRDVETDEEKAARARIPSWDDILLGVRRKHD
jgi:hypothetical protein